MSNIISKNTNIAKIPSYKWYDFFYKWLLFTRPLNNLIGSEIEVLSCFLSKRFDLLLLTKDNDTINRILRDSDTKKEIRFKLDVSESQFNTIYGRLKKKGIIVNNSLNPRYIPNVDIDSTQYKLMIIFDINEETKTDISE